METNNKLGLILTRKRGQSVIATLPTGEEIIFTILETNGNYVKTSTVAPDYIQVDRKEIKILKEFKKLYGEKN